MNKVYIKKDNDVALIGGTPVQSSTRVDSISIQSDGTLKQNGIAIFIIKGASSGQKWFKIGSRLGSSHAFNLSIRSLGHSMGASEISHVGSFEATFYGGSATPTVDLIESVGNLNGGIGVSDDNVYIYLIDSYYVGYIEVKYNSNFTPVTESDLIAITNQPDNWLSLASFSSNRPLKYSLAKSTPTSTNPLMTQADILPSALNNGTYYRLNMTIGREDTVEAVILFGDGMNAMPQSGSPVNTYGFIGNLYESRGNEVSSNTLCYFNVSAYAAYITYSQNAKIVFNNTNNLRFGWYQLNSNSKYYPGIKRVGGSGFSLYFEGFIWGYGSGYAQYFNKTVNENVTTVAEVAPS